MLLLSNINWVDIFVVICLIRTTYIGFSRGFSAEITRFLCVILVIVLTYHFYGRLGQFLSEDVLLTPEAAQKLSFLSLVIILALLSKLVCMIVRLMVRIKGPHAFEVTGGIIVGIARGILLASLILTFFEFLFPTYLNKSVYEGSFLGPKIINLASKTSQIFPKFKVDK